MYTDEPPIVPKGTMARYSLFVLLILVSGVVCNSHSSVQPRGPDPEKSGETPNLKHQAEDSQAVGECPADDEQVILR